MSYIRYEALKEAKEQNTDNPKVQLLSQYRLDTYIRIRWHLHICRVSGHSPVVMDKDTVGC